MSEDVFFYAIVMVSDNWDCIAPYSGKVRCKTKFEAAKHGVAAAKDCYPKFHVGSVCIQEPQDVVDELGKFAHDPVDEDLNQFIDARYRDQQ